MPARRALPVAALFDWDGTIADTLPLIYRANVVALGEIGIGLGRAWFRERYTPDWRRSYLELGVPEDRWDEVSERWAREMRAGRPRALPWARPALRRLRRAGIRLGLVTASTRAVVAPNLTRLHLDGAFEVTWFADDVANGKPHPEALLRALDELGVAPADSVYVGDTTIDLAMASSAGARFVAIGGTTPEADFRTAGADRVWASVGEWTDDLLGGGRPAVRRSGNTASAAARSRRPARRVAQPPRPA
jgi:HAD superfamily hydrolase (TIGR01509 family)